MAVLYVTEYQVPYGGYPVARAPAQVDQTVAIGVSSLKSAAFSVGTLLIRVHADAICSISIGTNPTATATTARMAANQTEYFGVAPGQQIAVITNS